MQIALETTACLMKIIEKPAKSGSWVAAMIVLKIQKLLKINVLTGLKSWRG
jgi:hypothetical protein